MKTLVELVTVILFAVGLSSCKKSYTCTCTKTYSGTSAYNVESTYNYTDSKKKAEDRCNQNETSGSDTYGAYHLDCGLSNNY